MVATYLKPNKPLKPVIERNPSGIPVGNSILASTKKAGYLGAKRIPTLPVILAFGNFKETSPMNSGETPGSGREIIP
ncbi:hypothetical protein D3C85_1018290 [compost metagenome]